MNHDQVRFSPFYKWENRDQLLYCQLETLGERLQTDTHHYIQVAKHTVALVGMPVLRLSPVAAKDASGTC